MHIYILTYLPTIHTYINKYIHTFAHTYQFRLQIPYEFIVQCLLYVNLCIILLFNACLHISKSGYLLHSYKMVWHNSDSECIGAVQGVYRRGVHTGISPSKAIIRSYVIVQFVIIVNHDSFMAKINSLAMVARPQSKST